MKWKDSSPRRSGPNFRQALDCASPLALWVKSRSGEKRQRTGTVQDASATTRAPGGPWPRLFARCAAAFLGAALLQAPCSLFACGPWFPNSLLDGGDAAVLVAPVADFIGELQRMKLVESRFQAVPLKGQEAGASFASQTAAAELADLTAVLKKAKVADEEAERIRSAHQAAREQLTKYLADMERSASSRRWVFDAKGSHLGEAESPPPAFPSIEVPAGLPGEFADYFEGALAWVNPAVIGHGLACAAWERLLERPPQERRYKSTWAAFMLG